MRRLMADPGHIDAVLAEGAERARALTDPILHEIHEIVGLISS
jgi:tryptophanyl-tRNA synthetase